MQNNILRNSEITKIYLIYTNANGLKRKENVTLRYMGDKECYFVGTLPINFVKPKQRSQIEIIVYTVDGMYKSTVKIFDANMNMNEVIYQCELPKVWNFTQLRQGSRKGTELNGILKFNDGETVEFTTSNLSVGGFSFYSEKSISTIYQRFACICELEFPKELLINFPDRKLITEAKFVRNQDGADEEYGKTLYGLKFVKLTNDELMILKNYLLGLQ